ncbi:MAG: prepilin peptidase [Fastidiosipilaceae bacterium]
MVAICTLIQLLIFIHAAHHDAYTGQVPDRYSLMIAATALPLLITHTRPLMAVCVAMVNASLGALPLLLSAILTRQRGRYQLGGADIKVTAALGFCCGATEAMWFVMVGGLALCGISLIREIGDPRPEISRRAGGKIIPFLPYILIASLR